MKTSRSDWQAAHEEAFRRFFRIHDWKKSRRWKHSRWVSDLSDMAAGNVFAAGLGYKEVEGDETPDLCVQIFVYRKLPESLIPKKLRIPGDIAGLPTDVIVSPSLHPCDGSVSGVCQPPVRPLKPGLSTSHFEIDGGSIGCFCRSTAPGADAAAVYLLGNNHVLAACNSASSGDAVYQPGRIHCGVAADTVAELDDYVSLDYSAAAENRVDAARALLKPGVGWSNDLPGGLTVGQPLAARVGMKVEKSGARTLATSGKVVSTDYRGPFEYVTATGARTAMFRDQIRIKKSGGDDFALDGDSGSVVYESGTGRGIGLLFAASGNGNIGIANPLALALDALQLAIP